MDHSESTVDALIGYSGFVGGNLAAQHHFGALYNSRNIADLYGQSFRTLVHAGTQAKKWWAIQHPDEDWQAIEVALNAIRTVKADRVVLISTIDVLPLVPGADERFACDSVGNHAYGVNRLRLEREITEHFRNVTVVRLPALFGRGLKKNVIYDLLHDNMLDKVNPDSRFQYYDLDGLWADIERTIAAQLGLVHLVTEPLATSELLNRMFPDRSVGGDRMPAVEYDFRSCHAEVFGGQNGYIAGRQTILRALERFVERERADGSLSVQ